MSTIRSLAHAASHISRSRTNRLALAAVLLLVLVAPARAQAPPHDGVPLEELRQEPPPPLDRAVSLAFDDVPLEEALRQMARAAGLDLAFATDVVAQRPPVTASLERVPAVEALLRVLAGTGLRAYRLQDGKVLIVRDAREAVGQRERERPRGQTIRGRVFDRDTRVPLPGANVIVLGTDPLLGAATDMDGRFVLHNVPLGRHDLRVSFLGYEPVILTEVLVASAREVVVDVALREEVLAGAEVTVTPEVRKDQPLDDMALVSARSFSVEETRRYAGGIDDPARMAASFAGVTGAVGLGDNALIIRGNAPKGVLWRLEGVEIPNPNHFAGLTIAGGGGLTLFSAQLLDDSDFFTSAFPAEYGNALAGVFDMHFRSGHHAHREHTLQASVLGLEAASEGPFVRGGRSTYLFNYRYSTMALLMPLLPTDSETIRYQDLSFKVDVPTSRYGQLEVWGIGGLDGQKMGAEQDSSRWERDWDRQTYDLNLAIGAAGATHTLSIGRRSYLQTKAAYTINRTVTETRWLGNDLALTDDVFIHDESSRLISGLVLNHKFGVRHVNRTGATAQRLFYDFDLRAAPAAGVPMVTVAEGAGQSTLLQAYSQSRLMLSPRVTLNAGVHAQYFALTGASTLEPRAGLQWQIDERQAVSLGYGLHSQVEPLRIYFVRQQAPDGGARYPNRDLDVAKAHHAVLGYDRRLSAATRLKAEAYYQRLFDVPVIADSTYSLLNWEQDWEFDEVLVNDGAGQNYGVDLTLERFLDDGWYYLATGSLFESRYRGGDGVWRDTRFDQGYSVNALVGKEFRVGSRPNLLGVNAQLVAMGGRRRSPVDAAASREREEVVYDGAHAYSVQEPDVILLDLTLTYRLNRQHRSEVWALQVKNVFATKDTYPAYDFKSNQVDQVEEGYPVPVLSYKVEF